MSIPPDLEPFWQAAVVAGARLDPGRFYEAFAFGDGPALAAELADLVLRGAKRATASLLWTYEAKQKPQPRIGDVSIVTSWSGRPMCVIETLAVDVVPFDQVTDAFARMEGEGDGTLASWKSNHEAFFARECERIGRRPSRDMPVVCEQFHVIYRPDPGRGSA